MPAPVLQFKRGNAGVAGTVPALRPGEPAISLNNFDFFIGIDTSVSNNKFFGSHRYWGREDGSESLKLKLVDKDGLNSINLKSPDTLVGTTTYTLPETIVDGFFLKTNSLGILEWSNEFPSIGVTAITAGIATFTDTTDNTLGDADTGAVQIDGGLGINKNVTIGGNLHVEGYSNFVGIVTFQGGTINLGDDNTDNINVGGEFISGLVPNTDDTHDLGASGQRWKTLNVVNINTTDISASGVSTFAGLVDVNGGLDVTGHTEIDDVNVSGIATIQNLDVQSDFDIYAPTATFHDNVIIEGNLTVNGLETIINTTTLTVQDKEIILGVGTNGSPNDTSASGGGVSIASTEGNPLVDFYIAGIHTHPNTYKDIIWVKADDLGVGTTDAWHFNYAVGIGSTQIPDGVRFAVTNTQITDSTLSTPQINISGVSTFTGAIDANGGLDVSGQTVLNNDLSVTGVSTFTGAIDVNGGLDVSGGETILSSATVSDLTAGRVVLAGTSGSLEDSTNLTFGTDGLIVGAGGINVTGVSTFSTDVVVDGDVRINGNDIKSSTGATAITLADNDVTIADDLTINGNLYVAGSTTQVNTASLTVEDRTIDLGIVNGAAPASDTTWDLGVLFNYHTSGSAKKSAVIWEHGDARFKFASVLGVDTDGFNNDAPQLSVTTFAPIEIGALWVNDCAGSSQVISCTGTERFLENITVDAGTF